jgi:DNA-directed RNA polymerase specialized sigma subunit
MNYDMLNKYMAYVQSFQTVTPAREKVLSSLILGHHGAERDAAIQELVNGNMRLVMSMTKKYQSYQDYLDIVFDGNLGLIKAANDFDSRKGRFSTHASQRIKTAIRDGMGGRLGSAHVPRTVMALAMRVRNAIRKTDKSNKELAIELKVKVKDVIAARLAMLAICDAIPISDEEGKEVEVPDPNSMNMFDDLQKIDLLSLVLRATEELGLTDDELVLVSEANLQGHNEARIAPSLAKKLGVSQSYVRMRRMKLVWEIRRRILAYIGRKEYLSLSFTGNLPARQWKGKELATSKNR